MRAVTGPRYGRIWNENVVEAMATRFGDGVTGDWRVPGEFGKRVEVTKDNTTLFAGDRDMFVFLADEDHRIEIPNRRNGQPGSLARGFFCWNSGGRRGHVRPRHVPVRLCLLQPNRVGRGAIWRGQNPPHRIGA